MDRACFFGTFAKNLPLIIKTPGGGGIWGGLFYSGEGIKWLEFNACQGRETDQVWGNSVILEFPNTIGPRGSFFEPIDIPEPQSPHLIRFLRA